MSYDPQTVTRWRVSCRVCKALDGDEYVSNANESWAKRWKPGACESAGEAEELGRTHLEQDGNYHHEVVITQYTLMARNI